MELVDSLEEMFQGPTLCYTLPNELMGPEVTTASCDDFLVDIEIPEINLVFEAAAPASHPGPVSIPLPPSHPVSIPPWHSHSWTTPVVTSAIATPTSIGIPFAVHSEPHSVQTGRSWIEFLAPTSPSSSKPNTPPVGKPKGSRGRGMARTKKGSHQSEFEAAELKSKENRLLVKTDHIVRERMRRDDMAAKYSILESLLPPALKRERVAVVQDAISFVEALQQKRAQLLNRRTDLKLMASCNQSPWSKKRRSLAPLGAPLRKSLGAVINSPQCDLKKQRLAPENCKSDSPSSTPSDDVVVRADPVDAASSSISAGVISTINVHFREEEIFMDMMWNKPRPNFQSALLQAVQSLGFDVRQCSILRAGSGFIQCVVNCTKSQALSQRILDIQSSSSLFIGALRSMLTQT